MIAKLKFLVFLIAISLLIGCSTDKEKGNVSALITDADGNPIPVYGVQVIDVNDGWLGVPENSFVGRNDQTASFTLPQDQPVILKFIAPGYRPVFTFLMPDFKPIDFEVSLSSLALPEDLNPTVVGNFNNFDNREAVKMEENEDGTWSANIETELDTIHYTININSMISPPGSSGQIIINPNSRGFERSFFSEFIKPDGEMSVTLKFDPTELPSEEVESDLKITTEQSSIINGVAAVYTKMTEEYMDFVFETVKHQQSGESGNYKHDFKPFITKLDSINKDYDHNTVSLAIDLNKLRFPNEIGLSKTQSTELLKRISTDSPLWMIHPTSLSNVLTESGVESYIDLIHDIAQNSPYPQLRGEALFNLIQHYHQNENEEEWHTAFFDLVSNYPDHFRTGFAYQNFAPEQPITEGKPLVYEEFRSLNGDETLNLHNLEESYLLIDFWATWCGPCIAAMPKLHDLHDEFKDSDFAIVSISVDEDVNQVHSFQNEWEMPWYNAHEKQQSSKIRELGIVGVPHYVLLGPDRMVLSKDQALLQSERLPDLLNSYLNNN